MRDIVEKKYTGHGPSRNIASFEIEFCGLFEGYLGQKLTGYGILKPTTHRVLEHKTFKLVSGEASIDLFSLGGLLPHYGPCDDSLENSCFQIFK